MEALRLTATALEGKLTLTVPESFNNQELEVIVLLQPKEQDTELKDPIEELAKRRMALFGSAKYPDFPITKYDAYNQ